MPVTMRVHQLQHQRMRESGGFEQGFNWFTDRHFRIWPLSLLRPAVNERFGARRVLVLGVITAVAAVVLVTLLRLIEGLPLDAFATIGVTIAALLLSWAWFGLAAVAWDRRAMRLGLEAERRV